MLNIICNHSIMESTFKKKTRRGKRSGRKTRIALFQNQKENQGNCEKGANNNVNGKYFDSLGNGCVTVNCDNNGGAPSNGIEKQWDRLGFVESDLVSTVVHKPVVHFRSNRCSFIRPRYSPKAPHNSTQFLMGDHESLMCRNDDDVEFYEPSYPEKDNFINYQIENNDFDLSNYTNEFSTSNSNGIEDFDLSDNFETRNFDEADSVMFMLNDFNQMYDSVRVEQLSSLSKCELIDAVKKLENEVNIRENKLIRTPSKSLGLTPKKLSNRKLNSNLKDLLSELDQLKSENLSMKKEIEDLQKMEI
ncbi:protein HEXIM1 [Patella vulgata]|uniref:protein HEXIM1 n=1 Tax=Patella vulgata TaxID=6465 RepID=UPI00217FE2BD|nr:protein HEXIM1 [Patella vulgata]